MKTVVIGLGRMGQRHIQAVKELGYELVAVSDIKEVPSEAKFYSDPHKMLREEKYDLAIIATTATSHHEYTLAASNNGAKYILCEKPMANSIAQCEEMIAVCKKNGTKLAINHPVNFTEADIFIKDALNSDKFGGLESITISGGNYGLAMNASHDIQMFRFLTDEEPRYVQAWLDKEPLANPRGPQYEDRSGMIRVTTTSGKTFVTNIRSSHGHGNFVTYAAKHGQIFYDTLADSLYFNYRKAEHREAPTTAYAKESEKENHVISSSDLIVRTKKVIQALTGGGKYPSGEDVINTIKVLAAAYISNENNHAVVDINDVSLPKERVFQWA